VGAANANDWGPSTNGIQMSIHLAGYKSDVKTNEPFALSVRYRNISTNEIVSIYECVDMEGDDNYSFIVKSPSGKDISPAKKFYPGGSGAVHVLRPGQTLEFGYELSDLCKFDETGTYIVIASFSQIDPVGPDPAFNVVSNPLQIKVVADQ
jgi:hypothetical protein